MGAAMTWSSEQYLKFEDERTRPARDLLQAVPTVRVASAADLGCGPGNSTELLVEHFPYARIVGVDNSADMIAAARTRLPYVEFRLGSVEDWNEPGPWDLLFANAVFQWVGNHERLFKRLAERLAPWGSLAIQMPDNLDEPSHTAMFDVAEAAPFVAKLAKAAKARTAIRGADWYYALLKPHCTRVDIWRTTYYHPLPGGVDAIVEWVRGTGLLPFLKPLSGKEQTAYLTAYKEELAKAYKPLADGTVMLAYPRLFIVATR
jgi:trans-aconitate 2-methyltransferase